MLYMYSMVGNRECIVTQAITYYTHTDRLLELKAHTKHQLIMSSIQTIKPHHPDSSGQQLNTISRLTSDTSQTYQDRTTISNKRFKLPVSATCKLPLRSAR